MKLYRLMKADPAMKDCRNLATGTQSGETNRMYPELSYTRRSELTKGNEVWVINKVT